MGSIEWGSGACRSWAHPKHAAPPQVYAWLGVEPPRGVLLHGPPGCGKTALAHAIANECGVPFLRVSAPEVVSGMSGESEAKLRQLFQARAPGALGRVRTQPRVPVPHPPQPFPLLTTDQPTQSNQTIQLF